MDNSENIDKVEESEANETDKVAGDETAAHEAVVNKENAVAEEETPEDKTDEVAVAEVKEPEIEETEAPKAQTVEKKVVAKKAVKSAKKAAEKKTENKEEGSKEDAAEEAPRPENTRWFTLRVYSGQEQKVKDHIQSELEIAGLQDKVFRILIPSETVIEMKNGKKKEKTRSFLPGYMIIEMEDDKRVQHVVSNTPGVVNFVGPKNTPQPLRPDEIDRMLGRMHEKKTSEVYDVPFKVGDPIRIIDGPFTDFTGFIDEINYEKNKLKVMVSIFGRSTPVELDFLQVKLEQ